MEKYDRLLLVGRASWHLGCVKAAFQVERFGVRGQRTKKLKLPQFPTVERALKADPERGFSSLNGACVLEFARKSSNGKRPLSLLFPLSRWLFLSAYFFSNLLFLGRPTKSEHDRLRTKKTQLPQMVDWSGQTLTEPFILKPGQDCLWYLRNRETFQLRGQKVLEAYRAFQKMAPKK